MTQTQTIGKTATTVKHDRYGFSTVTYHETDVVTFTSEKVTLDSGGWHTVTTKNRMNQTSAQFNLGFTVSQVKGLWFVSHQTAQRVSFYNGMTFEALGAPRDYRIVRFYHDNRPSRVVHGGDYLTLVEAQAHCNDPKTRKDGVYFDGYTDTRNPALIGSCGF